MASPALTLANALNVNANGPSQANSATLTVGTPGIGASQVAMVRPVSGMAVASSPGVQVVNMSSPHAPTPTVIAGAQPQKIMGPRIQTAATLRIQPAIAPRPNVIQMTGQNQQPVQLPPGYTIPPGTLLVKTDTGQLQLIHTGANQAAFITPGRNVTGTTQYRFAQAMPPAAAAAPHPPNGTAAPTPGASAIAVAGVVQQPQSIASVPSAAPNHVPSIASAQLRPVTGGVTTVSSPVAASSVPGSMPPPALPPGATFIAQPPSSAMTLNAAAMQTSALENVKKCKNFLSTLIKLAGSQPQETIKNVKELIQGLIDGKIQPEKFTEQLQIELKSSPQPYLVPFLKKSLPMLRQSLAAGSMAIEGVRAPAGFPVASIASVAGATSLPGGMAVMTNQMGVPGQHPLILQQRVMTSSTAGLMTRPTIIAAGTGGAPTAIALAPGQPVLQHQMAGTQLIRAPSGALVAGIGGIRPGVSIIPSSHAPTPATTLPTTTSSFATTVTLTPSSMTMGTTLASTRHHSVIASPASAVAATPTAAAASVGGPRIITVPNTAARFETGTVGKAMPKVSATPVTTVPSTTPPAPPGATVIPNPAMMGGGGGPRLIHVSTASHRNQSRFSAASSSSSSSSSSFSSIPSVVGSSRPHAATASPTPFLIRKEKHSGPAFKSVDSKLYRRVNCSPFQDYRKILKFPEEEEDEDFNDVAAMGGVNLNEENARILASQSDFIGTRIRSTKEIDGYSDSPSLVGTTPLLKRITDLAKASGVDEVNGEVASLVAYAVQHRLKNILERVNLIAEHRMEVPRTDSRLEVTSDVKPQLKFLADLDRLEKERQDEQERERLLKAAKSRSKMEDPEQLRLKQKAKELQQQEAENRRQIEANETALAAIGPRKKKAKFGDDMGGPSGGASEVDSSVDAASTSSVSGSTTRQRIKRVNLRDLIFLLEQEKETTKSNFLYRTFLK